MKTLLFFPLLLLLLLSSCNQKEYYRNEGYIFGTTYHIVYEYDKDVHDTIRARFNAYDASMSTYNKASLISRVNRNETNVPDSLLTAVIMKAQELNALSDGGFDITIAPLANAWGFGFSKADSITPELIDSLLQFTGMHRMRLENGKIVKDDPRIMLETSAVAEGFGVDYVGLLLESLGIDNYMVEVGGEVRMKGKNPKGNKWNIGIDKPIDDPTAQNREIQEILSVTDCAVSTSGNYRKFFIKDGKKYSHTIDPKSGYPVSHNLLSTTVVAHDCISSDGLGTTFMVLGFEKGMALAESLPNVEAYFIFADTTGQVKTAMTSGFEALIKKE
ncbi:MAG: FAD:protein FMN transferase [Breznakibacter sp.]